MSEHEYTAAGLPTRRPQRSEGAVLDAAWSEEERMTPRAEPCRDLTVLAEVEAQLQQLPTT
ncbi:hypothetical protein GCM10027174_26660 [Salinifilum aidingensis]